MEKARVSIGAEAVAATTDSGGRFELSGVSPGQVDLRVGIAGCSLMRKRINVPADPDFEVEIQFRSEPSIPRINEAMWPRHQARGTELRNLSSALFGDPLRSLQSLPGGTTNDEFYAESAYRGAGPTGVSYYLDGVAIRTPFRAFRGIGQLGSVSLFSDAVLDSVELISGATPAQYSGGVAAVVALESRPPDEDRASFRVRSDMFQTTLTAEGPLDHQRKVAALVSVRESYLQYFARALGASGLGLGYRDVNTNVSYAKSSQSRLSARFIGGSTHADGSDRVSERFLETLVAAGQRIDSGQATWTYAPRERTSLRSAFAWGRQTEDQRNLVDSPLLHSDERQTGFRHDASLGWAAGNTLEAGAETQRSSQHYQQFSAWDSIARTPGGPLQSVSDFHARTWQSGGYLQGSWTPGAKLRISAGGRLERFGYTNETVWLPRVSLVLALTGRLKWTASFGRFARFPDLVQLLGPFPNPALRAERTTQVQTGLALRTSHSTQLRVDLYDRSLRHIPYSEQTEWRLSGEHTLWPLIGAPLRDTVRGYSRGAEVILERRSANRIAGRISYSYGHARNNDTTTGAHFDADFDQRHVFQAYAGYRMSPKVNLSGKFRANSGGPIIGFFRGDPAASDPRFWLSDERNRLRAPAYQRLDIRADRAWYHRRSKLTLYGELSNVLNHRQWRYCPFDHVPFASSWNWLARDRMLPILPAVGVTIEF